MFERSIRDLSFVKRWGIVRTIRDQSVAEHSYFVAFYANDIASRFSFPDHIQMTILKRCLWHDIDEIFSGDLPGPNKRALVKDKDHWKNQLHTWMGTVFGPSQHRDGFFASNTEENARWNQIIELTIKAADWLDAAMEMATELQLGNGNVKDRVDFNTKKCLETLRDLTTILNDKEAWAYFQIKIPFSVQDAASGKSRGPTISGEDAGKLTSRSY